MTLPEGITWEAGKPAWCPADVWFNTAIEFDKLYDAEPDLEGGCEIGIRSMLARAILSAEERGAGRERERCAKLAEASRITTGPETKPDAAATIMRYGIAAAIRNGEGK